MRSALSHVVGGPELIALEDQLAIASLEGTLKTVGHYFDSLRYLPHDGTTPAAPIAPDLEGWSAANAVRLNLEEFKHEVRTCKARAPARRVTIGGPKGRANIGE